MSFPDRLPQRYTNEPPLVRALTGNASLPALAKRLLENGPVKTAPTSRRVRIVHAGVTVADTTRAVHVWEHPYYPYFYIPRADFTKAVLLEPVQDVVDNAHGHASVTRLSVNVPGGGAESTERVLMFEKSGQAKALEGMVRVEFGAVGMSFSPASLSFESADASHASTWY